MKEKRKKHKQQEESQQRAIDAIAAILKIEEPKQRGEIA